MSSVSNLKLIGPATYELPKSGSMRVPGLVFGTPELLSELDADRPLEQVANVAHLPGIVGHSIAMPDIHWGYGFPIGGVAAMDPEMGVISPGGVGYDINCGVRLAVAPLQFSELKETILDQLLEAIYQVVPSGVGHGHQSKKLKLKDYENLILQGARWSVEQGCGFPEDLEHTESYGCIPDADVECVSDHARDRGKNQLGSIGSGNHFVEIGQVDDIFLSATAKAWGIQRGQLYVLIHTGSRGFGHQVCQDTLNLFVKKGFAEGLPDRQLVAAPIRSAQGKNYFSAMAAAANFAFNNRQQVLHSVRLAFEQVLGVSPKNLRLIYDVCHNIAKFEKHRVGDEEKMLCIHRKGATRAFGPGAPELSPLFRETGQPVIVPGDMGTCSHVMVGLGNPLSWCSSCHGAGRAMSRTQSSKMWHDKNVFAAMRGRGVRVMATSTRTVSEEMPEAYKNVDAVVNAAQEAGLAKKVARLQPKLVIKG